MPNNSIVTDYKTAPFRPVSMHQPHIHANKRSDGTLILRTDEPLANRPHRLTARLAHWAAQTPDRVFIGQREKAPAGQLGNWQLLTYAQTHKQVLQLAGWLLTTDASSERPVVILSENSIEHGLLCVAALHVGLPVSVISPAYALRSTDFDKLRHVLQLLTPGLLFVQDGAAYSRALTTLAGNTTVLSAVNPPSLPGSISWETVMTTETVADATVIRQAHEQIQPETVAKIMFTSGSTGLPKGVINTHDNISTNWQQITQTFPFMENGGLTMIDWLPWNHTFGGNHNLGLTLFNGGTIYIDEGNPTPAGLETTLANLREWRPTMYCNVPRGFSELIPHLRQDPALADNFFSDLKLLFYAGAGMPQPIWDALEELAVARTGEKIVITTGLGCTESSPSALFASRPGGFAGLLGTPVREFDLKLVSTGGKLEARYKGRNVTPGYWRNPEATANAFDEEGFYCTGDALRFVNPNDPNEGLVFDGRIAEDFKLNTGTWVSVSTLRVKLIEAGQGLFADAVITGHDQAYVGAILFPDLNHCHKHYVLDGLNLSEIATHPALLDTLNTVLTTFANTTTGGSASQIKKAIFAPFLPSPDRGEVTEKGSINQRAVLTNHPELLGQLYP